MFALASCGPRRLVTPGISVRCTAQESATFAPAGTSVARARWFVRDTLGAWGAEAIADEAVLLTSELVTNAVVHAGTPTDVVCSLLLDGVEIDVVDRYPSRTLPPPPAGVALESEGGRGLQLATELADSWGVEYSPTTKRVWFRLLLPEVAPPPADPEADASLATAPDDALAVAAVRVGVDGTIQSWPSAAAVLFGWTAEELLGTPMSALLDPDAGREPPDWASGVRWQGSYGVRHRDGHYVVVHARHARVGDGDGSVVCLLVDQRLRAMLTEPAAAMSGEQAGRDDALLAPSAAMLVRLELDDLLQRIVEWVLDAIGGEGAFVLLATDAEHELELRATSGVGGALPRVTRITVDEGVTGRLSTDLMPVVHDDVAEEGTGLGWLHEAGVRSVATAPLLAEGRLIGAIGVTSDRPRRFTNDDAARLQKAADEIALPVQSARLSEIERRRRGWLSYLAEASDLLAGTLELEMTLALVAQVVVPRLASWCAVYLRDESGSSHAAYVWHADEEHLESLRLVLDKVPPPELVGLSGIEAWMPAHDLPSGGAGRGAEVVAAGATVLPLVARGRAIGSLVLGRPETGPVRREVLELAGDLVRRAALALDNARLYEERTATTRALQSSLLPPELPELSGVDVGVAYEAAGAGNDVGGDFYDVVPLGDGRFVFAVGDVCGKGPEAAAVTGLARHALRLLSRRGDSLPDVLDQLNAAILDEGPRARFITVVYGEGQRAEGGGLRLRLACAGHPAPFLLRRDGTVHRVGQMGDLLGVFAEPQTSVTEVELAPEESIVCVTDGVTERRDGARMLGEEGVSVVLAGSSQLPAAAVARRLQAAVTEFAASPPRDDMAVLVLRSV